MLIESCLLLSYLFVTLLPSLTWTPVVERGAFLQHGVSTYDQQIRCRMNRVRGYRMLPNSHYFSPTTSAECRKQI